MKSMIPAAMAAALSTGVAATPALAQSVDDWTGPYIGIHAGWLFSGQEEDERLVFDRDFDGAYDDTVVTAAGADAFSPGSCDGAGLGAAPGAGCSDDDTGVEAGLRAGYDFQFGNFVIGAVGEIGAADAEDTVTSFSTTPASYIFTRDLESTAALRARVGYAMGPKLAYVTGGAAYGKIENTFFTTNGANSFVEQQNEEDADGYQVGGGLEYRLAENLSLTGEYIYTSLEAGEYVVRAGNSGSTPAANPFILPPNAAGTDIARSNENFDTHSVRVGMNLRF